MKIKIHNDGKCKDQSFELTLEIDRPMIYGESKQDVLEQLKLFIRDLKLDLSAIDYEDTVDVDWSGEPI